MSSLELSDDGDSGTDLLQASSARIEALLTASAVGGVIAQERAEELVRVVVDLYGTGIERMLDLLHDAGRLDDAALEALAADPLVSGLLLVHGLHPDDVETRVARALDSVRPYLGSHGGDVELVEITDEGVVRLRLKGSCDSCASSSVTLELAVDGAVRDAAPEITDIEVIPAEKPAKGLISLSSLRLRTGSSGAAGASWHTLDGADDLPEGRAEARVVGSVSVVVCRIGSDLFAFRDRCPSCATALSGGSVHRMAGAPVGTGVLRCSGCGHHFDVRRGGAGLDGPPDAPEMLEPLPLLIRDGEVQVALSVDDPAPVPA